MKEAKPANRHACPRCDSTFTRPANRDHHVHVVHENHRDHACPHCAAAFGEASHLATHVRSQHPDNTQDNEWQSSAAAADVYAL